MVLIACVDERYGMAFNHRRQSSDRVVITKILTLLNGKRLWISQYSQSLFPKDVSICADDDFLIKAEEGEYCFAENCDVMTYFRNAEKIVLFHWNKHYPSDMRFPIEVLNREWKMVQSEDFVGNSHEKIVMEVFSR